MLMVLENKKSIDEEKKERIIQQHEFDEKRRVIVQIVNIFNFLESKTI